MTAQRPLASEYMHWAKTASQARFNLATSGILSVSASEFPLNNGELEINAPGGYGYPPLLQRIAAHAGVAEECVVTAAGTSMANHLAMAALLAPGDEVLIEQPGYGLLHEVAEYLQARITYLPRRADAKFAVDTAELKDALTPATRLIVLTNLHNPTGALLPADTLQEIAQIAFDNRAHVLVDEVYLEMLFDSDAPFAFRLGEKLGGGLANPFVVTNSLTKAYGLSGLRCGWIIAAPELAQRMWRLNDFFGVNAAHPAERLAVTAFDHFETFRNRARAIVAGNRPVLDDFLDSRADLDYFRPPAGTVAFPRLRRGTVDEFARLLREKYETSVVPGAFFGAPEHFRIGIGGDGDELRSGLQRIAEALDEFGGR